MITEKTEDEEEKEQREKKGGSLSLSRDLAISPQLATFVHKIKRFNNMIQGAAAIGTLRSDRSRYIKIIARHRSNDRSTGDRFQ